MADETYQGWKNWDTWAVNLWATNDEQFYRSRHMPWVKNFARKLKKGNFNKKLAEPAIKKYYVAEIIKIARKNGDDIDIKKVDVGEIVDSLVDEAKEYKE